METESSPATGQPKLRWYQYRLGTLFLLFVVLWLSLGVFGGAGIVVFFVAAVAAFVLNKAEGMLPSLLMLLGLASLSIGLLLQGIDESRSGSASTTSTGSQPQIVSARERESNGIRLGPVGGRLDEMGVGSDYPGINWPRQAALAVWIASVGFLLCRALRSRDLEPLSE